MSEFKRNFVFGVFYTSVAKYIGIVLQIIISAILARLLTPEDFGTVAIATVFIGFINLITDFGLAPAIVQKEELTKHDIKHLFSFTAYVGLFAAVVLFLMAKYISRFYDNENLISIMKILSLNVLFATLNIVPNALLLKAKKFKLIGIRTLLIQAIGGLLAICSAFGGLGLFSLVINSVFASLGIFVFNYYHNPLVFTIKINRAAIDKVIGFSLVQFMSQIITYVNGTIDKLLVGKFLGMSDLGYYEKSYRLMRMPVSNLTYVFTPVMQPMFKELKNDMISMEYKYGKLLKFISIIAFPLSAYLYFSASDLIYIFFGSNWMPAVRPFQLFSMSAGLMMLLSSTGPIYQASCSLKSQTASCIGEAIISLSCLYIGVLLGGVRNVAMFVSFGVFLRFLYSFFLIYKYVFHSSLFTILKNLYHGFFCMLCFGIISYLISNVSTEQFSIVRFISNSILFLVAVLLMLECTGLFSIKQLMANIIKRYI